MRIQMPWFMPMGLATGLAGTQIARHLFRAGGKRHWLEAWFVSALTWFPLIVWLLIQFPFVSR